MLALARFLRCRFRIIELPKSPRCRSAGNGLIVEAGIFHLL